MSERVGFDFFPVRMSVFDRHDARPHQSDVRDIGEHLGETPVPAFMDYTDDACMASGILNRSVATTEPNRGSIIYNGHAGLGNTVL